MFRHSNLRPFSDPANWIHYARHLKTEFSVSKWPVIYPLFLIVCEKLVGPINLFLCNLPVLILLLVSMGSVASWGTASSGYEQRGRLSPWPILTTAFLVLTFDPYLFVYLVNPYRDPLALLLRSGSLLLLILSVHPSRQRTAWLLAWASGLLLGLSTAVREPGILMLIPMVLFGIWAARRTEQLSFFRHALWCGVGLVMGVCPLVIQTLIVTGQVMQPAQSVADAHLIPGMEVSLAARTTAQAWDYYIQHGRVWLPILAVFGGLVGVCRRQVIMICLVLLPCALYAGFYCFYWTFVPRYFYFATVCMGALAAYFLHTLASILSTRIRRQSGTVWQAAVAITVALLSLLSLISLKADSARFSVADARDFVEWIDHTIPENDVVFTQRNLCEWIRILGRRESYPLREGLPDVCSDALPAKKLVDSIMEEGRGVWMAEFPRSRREPFERAILSRFYDLVSVAECETASLGLEGRLGKGPLVFSRIVPWSSTTSVCRIAPESSKDGNVVTLYGAAFTGAVSGARAPALWVNGERLAASVPDGLSFIKIPHHSVSKWSNVELRSDSTLPMVVPAIVGDSESDSFVVDLGFASDADTASFLTGMGHRFRQGSRVIRLETNGTIRLPRLWESETAVLTTILFNGPSYSVSNAPVLTMSYPGSPGISFRAARRRVFHKGGMLIRLSDKTDAISLSLQPFGESESLPTWMDIDALLVRAVDNEWEFPITVIPGTEHWMAGSGFYRTAFAPDESPAVWTDGVGQIWLFMPPGTDRDLEVRFWSSLLPPVLRHVPIRLYWNGQQLDTAEGASVEGSYDAITARILAESDETNPYGLLTIESESWTPSAFLGSPDTRPLGIMIKEITVKPVSSKRVASL